jgi:hypothetical protein
MEKERKKTTEQKESRKYRNIYSYYTDMLRRQKVKVGRRREITEERQRNAIT